MFHSTFILTAPLTVEIKLKVSGGALCTCLETLQNSSWHWTLKLLFFQFPSESSLNVHEDGYKGKSKSKHVKWRECLMKHSVVSTCMYLT